MGRLRETVKVESKLGVNSMDNFPYFKDFLNKTKT